MKYNGVGPKLTTVPNIVPEIADSGKHLDHVFKLAPWLSGQLLVRGRSREVKYPMTSTKASLKWS